MPKVTFINPKNQKQTVEVPAGTNLRTAALRNGVELYSGLHKIGNCRGFGVCSTCKVQVKQGERSLTPVGMLEWFVTRFHPLCFFDRIGREDQLMRLACQTRVDGDCEVATTPPMNISGETFWE